MSREARELHDDPTRRTILFGGATLAAATLMSSCDLLSSEPAGKEERRSGRPAGKGSEAPGLARRVRAGHLPPANQRLPKEPVIVKPVERIGRYGGSWHSVLLGPADTAWLDQLFLEPIVRWDDRAVRVLPNVARKVEPNSDGTAYVVTLREGMRWSDGQPFTADDIVFAQNDVYNNQEINPGQDDNPVTAEKVSSHVVKIALERPDALYFQIGLGSDLVNKPFHYLKKFHKAYNPNVDALASKAGLDGWVQLFGHKGGTIEGTPYNAVWQNKDLPRLHAWVPVKPLGTTERVSFRRNPYYWKTDPDGSQLPYIDELVFDITQDVEVMLLKATNGDLDMHFRHFNTPANKPVLARNRSKGDYRFFKTDPAIMNAALVVLNLTHEDPVKREILGNRDFRIGLSYAIDRVEINNTVYQRQGEPWQSAPRPESKFFDKEFAKQYTTFDPVRANHHLDRAGYAKRDGDGARLGPDGKPIQFSVEIASGSKSSPSDTAELLQRYWKNVGIDMRIRAEDRALLAVRNDSNKNDAILWEGDGGMNPVVVPDWYFPDPAYLTFGRLWSQWYDTAGDQGEKPPAPVRRQMALYDRLRATTDVDEQASLMRQILRISKEEYWLIGTVLAPPSYGIAKNGFHNVPDPILDPGQIYFQIDACQCFMDAEG